MNIAFTIKEDQGGLWSVNRGGAVVTTSLGFAAAIKLAGKLARDAQAVSGESTSVELAVPEFTTMLSRYEHPPTYLWGTVAA